MSQAPATNGFQTANPHALASILEASETKSIIAANDIFDIKGIKLWARDQPVSRELQQRLMDRALSKPLESSLIAQDGITADALRVAVYKLITDNGPLMPLLRPTPWHCNAPPHRSDCTRLCNCCSRRAKAHDPPLLHTRSKPWPWPER